jgi:HPt (histidine-containing phosphotransfer) domain-containing protein
MELSRLAEKLGLDRQECAELVELFIHTSLTDLATLRAALETCDSARAAEAAHSLKGAADNLMFAEICAIARELEAGARRNSLAGCREGIEAIAAEIEALRHMHRREGQR